MHIFVGFFIRFFDSLYRLYHVQGRQPLGIYFCGVSYQTNQGSVHPV